MTVDGGCSSLPILPMDSPEQLSFRCMAHSGNELKCEILGRTFITDFGQENHTLVEGKANSAGLFPPKG